MGESQRHRAEFQKLDSKGCMLYGCIKRSGKTRATAQLAGCLSGMQKALGLNPVPQKSEVPAHSVIQHSREGGRINCSRPMYLFSVAVKKAIAKSNLGGGGCLVCKSWSQPITVGSQSRYFKASAQGQELKQRGGGIQLTGIFLVTCFHSFTTQHLMPRDGTTHSVLVPPTHISNKENFLSTCLLAIWWRHCLNCCSSSPIALACIKLGRKKKWDSLSYVRPREKHIQKGRTERVSEPEFKR